MSNFFENRTTLVGDCREDDLIARVFQPHARGLGDDVAHLAPPPGHEVLVSTDLLVENVHFVRAARPEWVGRKAVAVNCSDLAASGAEPRWLTLSLALPPSLSLAWLEAFVAGFAAEANARGALLVGGDTTASPDGLFVNVTAMGTAPAGEAVKRDGARAGDLLAVTGTLGGAALGLSLVLGHGPRPLPGREEDALERHYLSPDRAPFARRLAAERLVHAMMDLSDGLNRDLDRLLVASAAGAVCELNDLPRTKLAPSSTADGFFLDGGEDYELLLALPEKALPRARAIATELDVPLTVIGRVTESRRLEWRRQGAPYTHHPGGWEHFGR